MSGVFFFKKKTKNCKVEIIKEKKINFKKELIQNKYYNKIYKLILYEIFPQLNKIHCVNWKSKTWEFLIGNWLYAYIVIICDRINIINSILKSKISNIDYFFNIGKKTSISSYDIRDFTYKSGLLNWNEKLFARLIYLIKKNNFDNVLNLINSQKYLTEGKISIFNKILYDTKIFFLKFLERIFCFKNKIILTNTYISNKIKFFKLFYKLRLFPFIYSFNFFNNKITKRGFNINLRNQLNIDHKNNNNDLNLKICKFLLKEAMPTVYLEGFKDQTKLAHSCHLPKKIDKIFTSSVYTDNIFKFWTAEQLNGNAKLYLGQHGGGYNLYKNWRIDSFENSISKKRFVWGQRKSSSRQISIGNYLLNSKFTFSNEATNNKKLLIILPALELFQRGASLNPRLFSRNEIFETQKILDNINFDLIKTLHLKTHPINNRRELIFDKFLKINKKSFFLNSSLATQKICKNYELIIFPYLSTEFFNQIALGKPCLIMINKNLFKYFFSITARNDFKELFKVGILHFDGRSLAKQINRIANGLNSWWKDKTVINVRKKFCLRYSNSSFNENLLLNSLK